MEFSNRVSQKLHDEHVATVAMMERLERLAMRRDPPDLADSGVARVLSDLASEFEGEVWRHFDFEEQELFSYLAAAGDAEIGRHLTEEHEIIRPLGARLLELARAAKGSGFDPAAWAEFRKLAQELTERMLSHVQKEEMALVPMLEEAMDAETEARLYESYVLNA
jgi:hemerythrin-like domain-containing protein